MVALISHIVHKDNICRRSNIYCVRCQCLSTSHIQYKVANENIRRICNNNWICLFQFTAKHYVPFSEHNFTSIKVQFNNFIQFFFSLSVQFFGCCVVQRILLCPVLFWDTVCRSPWVYRWHWGRETERQIIHLVLVCISSEYNFITRSPKSIYITVVLFLYPTLFELKMSSSDSYTQ